MSDIQSGFGKNPSESLITRILALTESMSAGEKRITDFLIKHQSSAVSLSQAELARKCDVSAPTVSRYVKRLGEKDYHAFQVSLVQSSIQLHGGFFGGSGHLERKVNEDDLEGSLQTVLDAQVMGITSSINSLDRRQLAEAVDLICSARMMEVAAAGRSTCVAMDAAYKFERLGILASTSQYYEKLLSMAVLLTPEDVLLIISRSGWSGVLQQVQNAALDHGAKVVLVTSNAKSPIAEKSDYVFLATIMDDILDGSRGNSRVCEFSIIEVLYALAASHKKDSSTYLKMHEEYVFSRVDLP